MRFSANLGFLYADRALPDAVRAAAAAGFEAIELHWPYATPAPELKAALEEVGLPLLSLNTDKGGEGAFGLSALPGEEAAARAAIDRAFVYGAAAGARAVHVMAGKAQGPAAHAVFVENLRYALERAAQTGAQIFLEPLNHRDAPGYYFTKMREAAAILDELGSDRVKIMFDVYHRQVEEGDLLKLFEAYADRIGHVQIAGAPERREPDTGEIAYPWLLDAMARHGYQGFIGAEYKPRADTDAGLGWLGAWRRKE